VVAASLQQQESAEIKSTFESVVFGKQKRVYPYFTFKNSVYIDEAGLRGLSHEQNARAFLGTR
jgi:hypothetical protein